MNKPLPACYRTTNWSSYNASLRKRRSLLPDLLGQIPGNEQIVTADGAYDTPRCHMAIIEREAVPIIPIRKNGRLWKENCPAARAGNDTFRTTRHYGRPF